MDRCVSGKTWLLAMLLVLLTGALAHSQDDDVIRINADNVTVPVSVLDRSGKYVSTLKQADFKIFEDGVEQEITSFETTDASVTVLMLLERNGAIRFQLPRLVAAANAFVRQMRPTDRFSAVTFGADRFTPIPETFIKDVPKGIRIETRAGDTLTLLFEAVDEGLKKIAKTQGRKAIVLFSEGIGRSFMNSLTVTIPSTVIPILIAAFAAYALAWMKIPARGFMISVVVGLLVVPLQMSLIPLLKLYNATGFLSKTYLGIWLAHTGFGLPFAIYLLRSYIAGLPRDLIESAQVDGANDFKIFRRIILPLSFPALASFAIFQFLWVWNDLLVAIVFLGTEPDKTVLTYQLNSLLGSRGGNWEILTASAFITIIVPLIVFFSLQRYFVRGLLAGSVKGG